MSLRNNWFVWFHHGKYLMVSEWTSNPGQLIIIITNYWQRKWLEYYQLSWIIMEGYDDLGSHMVGRRQTLRLENFKFDIAKCTAVSTIYKEIAGLIIGSEISRTWLLDCLIVSYLKKKVCIVFMHSNCEQIRQIWCLKTGMNLLVTFLDTMPLSLMCDNLKSMKYQPF